MSAEPPDNASTEPRISSTRNTVSLILLVISLIVGGIEVRAGLGQFLTMRALNSVSENNAFKEVPFAEAEKMLVGFPSKLPVETTELEDVHHYQWYSLLRPLTGSKSPELYMTSNHTDPPKAVSFYTSVEEFGHVDHNIPSSFSTAAHEPALVTPDSQPVSNHGAGAQSDATGADGSDEAK